MTIAPPSAAPAADGLLASLDAEQRAAATLPDGPAQIIAPAGSGKTTTLIARLGVLLGRGVVADRIGVVTFNRDAAAELSARIASRLAPHVAGAEAIEVRTLHAMARQVLLDAGRSVRLAGDRLPLLRAARRSALAERHIVADGKDPSPEPPDLAALDTIVSAWKVEGRAPPLEAMTTIRAFAALMEMRGLIDFDDLVVGAADALETDAALRARWQSRFSHICIDEFQDVDAAQLRLVQLLAAPEDNIFVVGDDDQTIYAWRLADVRRILGFRDAYPDASLVMLATNYRCPPGIVDASRRLIAVNAERFAKRIEAVPSAPVSKEPAIVAVSAAEPDWPEALVTALAAGIERGGTAAVLARTRSELLPIVSAVLRLGIRHRTTEPALLEVPPVTTLLGDLERADDAVHPFHVLVELRRTRGWTRAESDELSDDDQAAIDALLGWSTAFRTVTALRAAAAETLARVRALRGPDTRLELLTVHGAKGREWEEVALIGVEEDRFPNRRALLGASDPKRALEEERRLGYVAVTRATRRLLLVFDPTRPSPFIAEMGLRVAYRPTSGATGVR